MEEHQNVATVTVLGSIFLAGLQLLQKSVYISIWNFIQMSHKKYVPSLICFQAFVIF